MKAKAERRHLDAEVARLRADLRDEQGTREGLEKRIRRIWALLPQSIRHDARVHDVEDGVALLAATLVRVEGERDAARENHLKVMRERDEAILERDRLSREFAARQDLEERLGGSGG